MQGTEVISATHSSSLVWEIHRPRSLAGYSPWGRKELDTDKLGFPGGASDEEPACQWRRCKICGFNPWLMKILWRRDGNPLQYSCLENLMDSGAWKATVHGVTKSWTRLKRLTHTSLRNTHTYTRFFSKTRLCLWFNGP